MTNDDYNDGVTWYKIYNKHGVEIFDNLPKFSKRYWYYRIMYDETKNKEDNYNYSSNRRNVTFKMIQFCRSKKDMLHFMKGYKGKISAGKMDELKQCYGDLRQT